MMPHPTNAVLVGKKKTASYVMAVLRMFTQEGLEEVVVKARGANVYKAVEVATRVVGTLESVKVENVKVGSERLKDKNGAVRRVSSIEVSLRKQKY
ncbi:MAG: RNA-binding protein [Acidilobaceae archaeon]|nr:RNA-binding protein [Acidilobaceae archaeon]MCX8165300.1 RNA-binding protein [Acidilobaceae archaeon]MDW7973726.1 RNA-binding protein [Sulfolobales archaeon]